MENLLPKINNSEIDFAIKDNELIIFWRNYYY